MELQALLREANADAGGLTWFRATSEARDRHGTVIESAGVDVEPFLRNPVVGWGHRAIRGGDPDDVLGRVDSIERGDGFIDVGVRFATHARAQLTEKLVRDGFLSAMSVGILPRKTATKKVNGQSVPVIRESELLEVSIVPVGSNPEAQKLLRDIVGADASEEGGEDMDAVEIREIVSEVVKPIGARLDTLEKTLDEPERKPALGGARTTEDVEDLAGRWLKARAFNDQKTILEIAESDPAPEAEVRNMLSANAYLPTAVSSRLIQLVGESSKFLNRAGSLSDSALSVQLPRESAKLSAAFVAENTNVIAGNAALDSVTLTAKNAWAGERVPNRVLADQPVATAAMLPAARLRCPGCPLRRGVHRGHDLGRFDRRDRGVAGHHHQRDPARGRAGRCGHGCGEDQLGVLRASGAGPPPGRVGGQRDLRAEPVGAAGLQHPTGVRIR